MTEIPQPSPLVEQVRQDPSFSLILEDNPSALDMLVELSHPDSGKSGKFWITYLARYNTYASVSRDDLNRADEGIMPLPLKYLVEMQKDAVVGWTSSMVPEAINASANSNFEEGELGILFNEVTNMVNTPEEVMECSHLILGMPERIIEIV